MSEGTVREHDCDLCGSADAAEIPVARAYTGGQPLHVCRGCGFVYVRRRRSAAAVARAWSEDVFKEGAERGYTARIPAVKARQVYVAEFIADTVGLAGKSACDIGAGEGQFLEIVRDEPYAAEVFGVEPSADNCRAMSEAGIPGFEGRIEEFARSDAARERRFDLVTIMWTLENCQSCRAMLDAAHGLLRDGGHLVVATGSRILVPFRKPLHLYLSTNPADTHCFRFSAHTLGGLMAVSGFRPVHVNRYIDTDYLVMIGERTDRSRPIPWERDDARAVIDFFRRWDKETGDHYPDG